MPIYVIGNGNGQIKIGYSVDPLSRLATLQTASPCALTLLALHPGGMATEAGLHERYAEYRLNGEWFACSDELDVFIEFCNKAHPMDSFFNQDEAKMAWDEAFADWSAKTDMIDNEFDPKIEALELEKEMRTEAVDREFDEKTRGIIPWWLREYN